MIGTAFCIAFIVLFMHTTTTEGHIFNRPAQWLENHLPEWTIKPLFGCPICMTPYWGTALYLLLFDHHNGIKAGIATVATAAGISCLLVFFSIIANVMDNETVDDTE